MAIVGTEINFEISEQIKARQKLHGSGVDDFRYNDQIAVLNSQNAWVKLASGVSVTEEKCTEIGVDVFENSGLGLAENNVLFGGTSKVLVNSLIQRTRFLEDGTYQNSDFGIVPMPGIISVDVKTLTRGSIKKATVKLKAYSRAQFYIIDTLYLRLGYTVMLEWGNNIYTSDGVHKSEIGTTYIDSLDGFFNSVADNTGVNFNKALDAIISNTYKYEGNYDGMIGKITNFNWTFKDDGSYDISLDIHSLGDVVESLKMNLPVGTAFKNFSKGVDDALTDNDTDIQKGRDKSYIHYVLWLLKFINSGNQTFTGLPIFMQDEELEVYPLGGFVDPSRRKLTSQRWKIEFPILKYNEGFVRVEEELGEGELEDLGEWIYWVYAVKGNWGDFRDKQWYWGGAAIPVIESIRGRIGRKDFSDKSNKRQLTLGTYAYSAWEGDFEGLLAAEQGIANVVITPLGETEIRNPFTGFKITDVVKLRNSEGPELFYLRFGAFLKFLKEKIVPTYDDGEKVVNINWFNSVMFMMPNQISLDPRVCIFKNSITKLPADKTNAKEYEIELFSGLPDVVDNAGNGGKLTGVSNYGTPLNIYLNLDMIYTCLEDNTDANGKVSLYDLLSSICTKLNVALGGVNNLEPVISESDNTLRIIDTTPLPGQVPQAGDYVLNLYGYNTVLGKTIGSNFIRKLDIKTAITPEFATMVTVGATAGGYTKGVEATAFSKWNLGIKDRYKERIVNSDEVDNANSDPSGSLSILPDPLVEYISDFLEKKSQILGFKRSDIYPEGRFEIDGDVIDKNISVVSEFYKFAIAEKTKALQDNSVFGGTIGFIPFKLQFTMDGLSGIKIYNVLHIDTSFLPKAYGKSLDFIVTGLEHKLNKDDWETTITVNVMPKSLVASELKNYLFLYDNYQDQINLVWATKVKTDKAERDVAGANNTAASNAPNSSNAVSGGSASAGDSVSTPSGFILKSNAYKKRKTTKTQIFLHHTAGSQRADKGKQCVSVFNSGNVSTHAVIDKTGHIEYVLDDDFISYHAGVWKNNEWGLSVEIQSYGPLTKVGSKFKNWAGGIIPDSEVVKTVDKNGNEAPYKGKTYWHKFTPAQIASTKVLVEKWLKKHNIPFKWDSTSFDTLFPAAGTTNAGALAGNKGLYTHNSVRKDKVDIFPQKEMIDMLKTIKSP